MSIPARDRMIMALDGQSTHAKFYTRLELAPSVLTVAVDGVGPLRFPIGPKRAVELIALAAYPKYGHPVQDAALLRALSPIHHFDALCAPVLVVHGENDSNVPVEEAEQVVAGARARGVPVEYLLFAGEGHEIMQPHNRARFVEVTVEWLAVQLGA